MQPASSEEALLGLPPPPPPPPPPAAAAAAIAAIAAIGGSGESGGKGAAALQNRQQPVPMRCYSLAEAVAAARDGDVIQLLPGVHVVSQVSMSPERVQL